MYLLQIHTLFEGCVLQIHKNTYSAHMTGILYSSQAVKCNTLWIWNYGPHVAPVSLFVATRVALPRCYRGDRLSCDIIIYVGIVRPGHMLP
jgi:hypothetical protein